MADKDFDGGFGIGGLGRVPESTPENIPVTEDQIIKTSKPIAWFTCSRCGGSFPYLWAMSSSSGSVCPDCYDDASY